MKIYSFQTYKAILRAVMSERQKQFGARFTYEKMSQACGIQKTYLSKVLNSSAALNPDQLFAACEYLKLSADETDFVLLLRELELANNERRASRLTARLREIRRANLKTEAAITVESEKAIEVNLWEYYSNIDLQLVHMFMTVPHYAKNSKLIGPLIGIEEAQLQNILLKLVEWKILRFERGTYVAKDPRLHLSEDSPVFPIYSILNRIKTVEKLRRSSNTSADQYFFSAVFSADTQIQDKMKQKLLTVLREFQQEVIEAKPEVVLQLNIDLFKWG